MVNIASAKISRSLYADALIVFGVQNFMFSDFIAGRAPAWPAGLPGQVPFAYVTGAMLLIGGLSIFINKKSRLLLLITGIVILLWAGLRNIIPVVINLDYGAALTSTFKALTLGTGAFLVAHTFNTDGDFPSDKLISRLAPTARYAVGSFMLVGGIQHFIFADFVKFLVPTWIPGALFWTYFAGVALGLAGLSLLTGIKTSLAAHLAAWMVLTWVFVLHLPRAFAEQNQNEWTAVFEALAVSGILFLVSRQEVEETRVRG